MRSQSRIILTKEGAAPELFFQNPEKIIHFLDGAIQGRNTQNKQQGYLVVIHCTALLLMGFLLELIHTSHFHLWAGDSQTGQTILFY